MIAPEQRPPQTVDDLPDLDRLPRDRRLALVYAPARWRADVAALMLLDTQLAGFAAAASEPVLGQMRLAWWRDRFAGPVAQWPRGNPLLARLSGWGQHAARLERLVDGWESLLAERPLDGAAIAALADNRARGWEALAGHVDYAKDMVSVRTAAKRWALVDFAWSLAEAGEHAAALKLAENLPPAKRIGAPLRSLSVLETLACRSLATGRPPLSRATDLLFALRGGLFGR